MHLFQFHPILELVLLAPFFIMTGIILVSNYREDRRLASCVKHTPPKTPLSH